MSRLAQRSALVVLATATVLTGCASTGSPLSAERYGPKNTWLDTQFDQVVAQQNDFSCGAAALATLLTHYYGLEIDESDVLALADKEAQQQLEDANGRAVTPAEAQKTGAESIQVTGFSFAELARFARAFGFQGKGYSADFAALQTLKVPVIAHIGTDWYQHFVVLREVNSDYVVYADPTWGNRRMTSGRFQELWSYSEGTFGQGRVLAILPGEHRQGVKPAEGFFDG